jgi:hypothetical protein
MSFPIQPSPNQGSSSPVLSLPTLEWLIPSHLHLPFAWFDGAKEDALPKVFHETIKEDKGKELAFGGFKSFLPVDTKDMEMNPLHVIFDLKGVLVGKDSFRINHFLLLLLNLA